nr:iron-siderophore ABC transporter substrate-binding protein [Hoyosella altamirensis]
MRIGCRLRAQRGVRASVLAVLLFVLAACGNSPDGPGGSGGEAGPVTVSHAFGDTAIPEPPDRVVTWGWGSADAAIALGVVPAAIPFQSYGGDEEGVLPWIRDALDKQGADTPTVLPNVTEVPFEAIAAAEPDLILAVYSGITEQEYELLSQIAPTVAYPDQPWATEWRDTIRIVGDALGRSAKAAELLEDIDVQVAAKAAENPVLRGKSVAMVWDTPEAFYVYKPADPRVAFMLDLGFVTADSLDELASGDSTFYFTLSKERLGDLTSDVLVTYSDTPEESAAFLASPEAELMDQVQRGAVAEVVGTAFIASVSPPTALSLTWGLDSYVELLSAAAERAEG